MTMITNPLSLDPTFANARKRIQRGDLGQCLAIYAVARAREALDDALTTLGLPLVQDILTTAGESPVSVTAVRVAAGTGFKQWSAIITLESGIRLTLDVASGLGAAASREFDLRVEWSGATQAILIDPTNVAVTVVRGAGVRRHSAEISPIAGALTGFAETARSIVAEPVDSWRLAAGVISAIPESVNRGTPVRV